MEDRFGFNKEYPIHAVDIQRLTSLSTEGDTLSTAFQTTSNRDKKTRNDDYYTKYDTKRGGKGACIDLINTPKIKIACYIIAGKMMCHFSKNGADIRTIV